jgi:hypothetical protein
VVSTANGDLPVEIEIGFRMRTSGLWTFSVEGVKAELRRFMQVTYLGSTTGVGVDPDQRRSLMPVSYIGFSTSGENRCDLVRFTLRQQKLEFRDNANYYQDVREQTRVEVGMVYRVELKPLF